jgi:hypothetical protein
MGKNITKCHLELVLEFHDAACEDSACEDSACEIVGRAHSNQLNRSYADYCSLSLIVAS